jgi:signal transduction histidine kinase
VQVYDVRARSAAPGTMRGIEGLRSPLIGRAAELDALQLEVIDDGVGLPAALRGHAGVGLTSMRERAAELGGRCVIEPAPKGGTRVKAQLPLSTSGQSS